jgi:hypothetical protein
MRTKNKQLLIVAIALMYPAAVVYSQDTLPVKTLPPVVITATNTKVPEKVWQNFKDYFANAESPKWYEMNKKYLVEYMTDEDINRALFTKRGSLVYNISYGYEKNLPDDIRVAIKGSYLEYDVTRAIMVSEADRIIWVVNLESKENLVMVRCENGEMEEVQKVHKS